MEKNQANEKIYLTGNISNDIKESQVNNTKKIDFDIASNPEGEKKYTKIQAWGNLAEKILEKQAEKADKENSGLKGQKLSVRGQEVTYTAKDEERTVLKLDTVQFHNLQKEEKMTITGIHNDSKGKQPYKINTENEKGENKILLIHDQNKHLVDKETLKVGDKLIVDGDQKNAGYYIAKGSLQEQKRMPEVNPTKISLEQNKNKILLYDKYEGKTADKATTQEKGKKEKVSDKSKTKSTPKVPKAKGMSV